MSVDLTIITELTAFCRRCGIVAILVDWISHELVIMVSDIIIKYRKSDTSIRCKLATRDFRHILI